MSEPYTHALHWQRGIRAGITKRQTLEGQLVQVKKHGTTFCARISEAYTVPNGPDCWVVDAFEPFEMRFTVICKNVRECGGAGCTCAAVDGNAAGRSAATTLPQQPENGQKG